MRKPESNACTSATELDRLGLEFRAAGAEKVEATLQENALWTVTATYPETAQ